MTDTRTANMTALLGGGTEADRISATHFLTGAVFGILGAGLQVLSLIALRFPGLFPVSYGRIEMAANLTLVIGFVTISLVGGVYYVLPRLTGTQLRMPNMGRLAMLGMAALALAGIAAVFLGFGDGLQPFGLPWWLDIPLAGVLFVPALVTIATIRERVEQRSFVTLWFVIGGVLWLPLLYVAHLVTELPFASAVAVAYAETFLSSGFITMFMVTVGSGLVYYALVKELEVPLASRQLALVGFWSLGFAGVWWGAAQLLFGPGPTWLAGVAAALGLAWPIGALANAANVSLSLEGSWSELSDHPGVVSGILGLYLTVGVSLVAALGGFPAVGAVIGTTAFWEAVEHTALTGIGVLLVSSTVFSALPRLVGRELETKARARRFHRLSVTGAVGLLLSLCAAGFLAGYSWIAGSNSAAYVDAGEGWAAGLGNSYDTLILVALVFSGVLFLGVGSYSAIVLGTVARGRAIPQEVLVPREVDDE